MKKLFFFKSSSSHGSQHREISAASKDKRHRIETQWKEAYSQNMQNKFQNHRDLSPVSGRKVAENETMSRTRSLVLRRSRSLSTSSAANDESRLVEEDLTHFRNQRKYPSSSGISAPLCDCPDCHFQLTEKDVKPERHYTPTIQVPGDEALFDRACSNPSYPSSPRSSFDSTSIPGKVLDLYIDGEHHQEMKFGIIDRRISCNPAKERFDSFPSSNLFLPSHGASKGRLRPKKRPDSPRKLAKDVVERLSRLEQHCASKLKSTDEKDALVLRECSPFTEIENENSLLEHKEHDFDTDSELAKKLEDAKEKATVLYRELFQENSVQYYAGNASPLSRRVRVLLEEQRNLVLEICEQLQCRIAERVAAKEAFSLADATRSENEDLQKRLLDIHEKLKVAEEVQSCLERNHKEKEKENAGLIRTMSRIQGTCSEQERTIDGLRHCLSSGKTESKTEKLQMEQLRLTGVEQVLRRQLEVNTTEVEALRSENIYLLERLKKDGKVSGSSGVKLDQELASCVQSLQKLGLSLLNESIHMSVKLLGILKSKSKNDVFLEAHCLVECDMKVHGFKKGAEELARSLRKAASTLNERDEAITSEDERFQITNKEVLEDDLNSELKAERLVTSLLKEKLYSKEKEVEQLQAELARALSNHDVCKSEIQSASDAVSRVNHEMKNLELQMIKKDGTINQLEGEVRSLGRELSSTRGILSKVSQERDLIWEEMKQNSERNMLLNCEVSSLKKKVEVLEEDTLLKDGQISILKDSVNSTRHFDAFFASEHGVKF